MADFKIRTGGEGRAPRAFAIGFLSAFLGLLVVTELLARGTDAAGYWYRSFDFSGRLVSLAELERRVANHAEREPSSVVLLGDSVPGSGALLSAHVTAAEAASLSTRLREALQPKHGLLTLSADGLLLPDIEAIVRVLEHRPPAAVVLLLNYRMFAPELESPGAGLSRPFLAPDGGRDESQSARWEADLHRYSALFRTTQLLKTLWFYPSRQDLMQRLLERALGQKESDDLTYASLMLKVSPYYRDVEWSSGAPAMKALRAILARLRRLGVAAHVVLTPQNVVGLGSAIDPEILARNRTLLRTEVEALGGSTGFHDWAPRYPQELFLDHCHLTATGNQRLAEDLAALVIEAGS